MGGCNPNPNRGNDCRYPARRARSSVDIDGLPSVACAKRINAPSEGIEMTAFAVASTRLPLMSLLHLTNPTLYMSRPYLLLTLPTQI